MSVLELNGRVFDASTTGTLTLTGEGSATTDVTQGLAKSWINFNGTGTAAINDSLNTSGITDNGTGTHTITITNDFSTVNYSLTTGIRGVSGTSHAIAVIDIDTAPLVGAFKMATLQSGSSQTALDCPILNCTAHGDLA